MFPVASQGAGACARRIRRGPLTRCGWSLSVCDVAVAHSMVSQLKIWAPRPSPGGGRSVAFQSRSMGVCARIRMRFARTACIISCLLCWAVRENPPMRAAMG